MAEEIKQHEMVRYESSLDLQDAWLKAVDMDMGDLANYWKESILVLRQMMFDHSDPATAFKAANRLSFLLSDITKSYADSKVVKPSRGSTIDIDRNPFGERSETNGL